MKVDEYTLEQAHADGRHESTHPEDRRFWAGQGCTGCSGVR